MSTARAPADARGGSREVFPQRVDCFGVPVARTIWHAVRAWFFDAIERRDTETLYFVNAHTLNLAWSDPGYREILRRGHTVLNDGIGVSIYGRLAGMPFDENFNGTDLLPRLFDEADARRPLRAFLYGAVPGRADVAARKITRAFAGRVEIVGALDGYVREGVVERICEVSPDVVLVGMGNPLQERWIDENRPRLDAGVVAGVGALIDFLSGAISRAPAWMRDVHFEWIYRFGLEPRRLFRRYFFGNPIFLARAAGYLRFGVRPKT